MSLNHKPRVIVCQYGTRRRYSLPRILDEAGMLYAFYTDTCEYSLLGKVAKVFGKRFAYFNKIANRKLNGIAKNKIYTTDKPLIYSLLSLKYHRLNGILRYYKSYQLFSNVMINWGVGDSDIIYTFHHSTIEFLEFAKNLKKHLIIDVCVNPLTRRIINAQIEKEHLEIQAKYNTHNILEEELLFKKIADIADILLCPSAWVIDGVNKLCPEHKHKLRYCPYGSSIEFGGKRNQPIKGRLLWAGRDWFRKGLTHLAKLSNQLKPKYPELDFRIAGITDQAIINKSEFMNLHFLGDLDSDQMRQEFLSADIFVFPTLSEGQAGVILQAIAAGCPVITTRCAGIDDIHTDVNGIIIPENDITALRNAVEKIYKDRDYRNRLAENTLKLTHNYTMKAWSERLIGILNEIHTI
jgi:glycosyltransferase involved in cell wall biosynthesis